jgi:ankyrin repeat protein
MIIFKRVIIFLLALSFFITCFAAEIHKAALEGDIEKIKILLKKTPGLLNARDEGGMTPLIMAIIGDKKELIKLLLDSGADVTAANNAGFTALDSAVFSGNKETVELLIAKGADVNTKSMLGTTPLLLSVTRGHSKLLDVLIKKGASVDVSDNMGSTPLLLAALTGKRTMVELLIGKGVDMNRANNRGSTPLSVADREGYKEIVDLLLAKGAANTLRNRPVLQGDYLGQAKPGQVPVIFAPGFVSTEIPQLNAVFTPDGKEFYFSVRKTNAPFAIMVTKLVNNRWTKPEIAPFSGTYSDVDQSIAADGKTFFFCSNRPVNKGGKTKDHDFWVMERTGAGWGEPFHLGFEVNTDKEDFYPTVTRDGTLYFSSQREGQGTNNVYRSRLVNGKYTKAEKLSDAVNTRHREFDPFIAADESFIIFASGRPGGYGASDLYVSFRQKDGTWKKAKNMGSTINSERSDYTPMLSPDGKYLFFTSGRGGVDDIYWVDAGIIEKLKKE